MADIKQGCNLCFLELFKQFYYFLPKIHYIIHIQHPFILYTLIIMPTIFCSVNLSENLVHYNIQALLSFNTPKYQISKPTTLTRRCPLKTILTMRSK